MDDTVFENDQLEEDDDLLEDLDEDERIIEDEEDEIESDQDLEFDEEKVISDDESSKIKTDSNKQQSKTRDRLLSDDFEFECDLTDSERNLMRKIDEKNQSISTASKKVKSTSKRTKNSQSSDENLLSPYRRQSVGHSPTNRGTSSRPQLINTKKLKKFKTRLHTDASSYRRRYSDVFFSNTPPISQPSSGLSNISDRVIGSTSSTTKLDSRPQSAFDNFLNVVQPLPSLSQQMTNVDALDKKQSMTKDEFKLASEQKISQKPFTSITTSIIQPTYHYVRNRSPSCAVVPSHYVKQQQTNPHRESIVVDKQTKRRGMSLSFTPQGARQLTNQVTRKLSKQFLKLNRSTKNLLFKSSKLSPKTKEHSISMESSKDVVRDMADYYSSIETPPSSSIILGANLLVYPMINSPVQAKLTQALNEASVSNTKLDAFDLTAGIKVKEHQTSKDGHMFMNQMKKAKNIFKSFMPLQYQADTFTSNLFDLKKCIPTIYYSSKGIDKSIKVSE